MDVSRGCVLASSDNSLHISASMAVTLLWMDEAELKEGDPYRVQIGTFATFGTVKRIRHLIDINTGKAVRSTVVRKNDLALCELQLGMPAVMDSFSSTPALGELILIDRVSHATSACGIVEYPLGEEGDIYAQEVSVNREMREKRFGCRAQTIWMTGLSGAGKSTLADQIEKVLFASGIPTMLLDGDNVRSGLCAGLGFSAEGRRENIRRVAEAAKLLNDAGVTVIAAFVSPFREDREMARRIIGSAFMEVYVNASLEECIRRDTKGIYKKAMRGEIREFTGISSPYEIPLEPEVEVRTDRDSEEACCRQILERIREGQSLR